MKPSLDSPGVPRRVLMTADTVGGVWTYALELARALAPWGVEVTLATMGAPLSAAQWVEARALGNLRVEESRFALEWMDEPWDDVRAAGEWLLSLEARVRPDVVHLNGYAHGALPWVRRPLVVGHSCVLSWWHAVKGEDAPERYARYRRAVVAGLHAAGRVVAPSEALLDALRTHYGPLPSAEVISNARRAEDFPPGTEHEPIGSSAGRTEDAPLGAKPARISSARSAGRREPFILSAGRLWDEAKNVAALEAAAPRLGWPVKVAGDSRHPNGTRVESLHVEMLGLLPPPELARWMRRASVYALPARYEPFGLSALEAALSGCALVLGDIPSLREVWGDAALFVPPTDVDVLVDALESLRRDEALRTVLATRARARALTYTPQRMAAGYLSVYAGLMGARDMAPTSSRTGREQNPLQESPSP